MKKLYYSKFEFQFDNIPQNTIGNNVESLQPKWLKARHFGPHSQPPFISKVLENCEKVKALCFLQLLTIGKMMSNHIICSTLNCMHYFLKTVQRRRNIYKYITKTIILKLSHSLCRNQFQIEKYSSKALVQAGVVVLALVVVQ